VLHGPFRLHVTERLLEKTGTALKVGSRALDILLMLLEHAPEVVGKRRLIRRVWGNWSSMRSGPQGPIWHQEGPYDVGPELQYVPHYTGRVEANLSRSDGVQMRCRFNLMRPVDGMAGGARGECQLPDGPSVDTQFPAD